MIQPLFIFSDIGLLVLRLVLGLIMVIHGWPKIKNLQKTKIVAGAVEFLGGLMIIFGFLTQIAALFIFIQFAVAILLKIKRKADFVNGYEFDLLIAAAALALAFFGGGYYSLDEFFKIIIY